MIKVLILSHDFPPVSKIGALRAYSWYLDLPKSGIHPVVITRNWSDATANVMEPAADSTLITCEPTDLCLRDQLVERYGLDKLVMVRKALTALGTLTKFSSSFGDDLRYLFKAADKWLSQNKADVILATGEPFILFKYAHTLGKKYKLPYVLDYRDGWTTNHVRKASGPLSRFLGGVEKFHEKRFLKSAAFFTSVSQQLVSTIAWNFEQVLEQGQGRVLPNGVELSFYEKSKPAREKQFTILYTGTLYQEQRVDIFIEGFRLWKKQNPQANAKVVFIGIEKRLNNRTQQVKDFASENPADCSVLPAVSFQEAIDWQRRAHMLLSLIPGSQAKGIMAGKTYEYAATGNPILLIPSEGNRETTFFPGRDIQHFAFKAEEVAAVIDGYYEKFKRGESTTTSISNEEVYSISRSFQAKRLAEMLHVLHEGNFPKEANLLERVSRAKAS